LDQQEQLDLDQLELLDLQVPQELQVLQVQESLVQLELKVPLGWVPQVPQELRGLQAVLEEQLDQSEPQAQPALLVELVQLDKLDQLAQEIL
jgi:hypothetical protein